MAGQGRRRSGRDGTDPQLERRSVWNELGHVLADPPLDIADLAAVILVGWHVDLDRQVDLVDVDEALAERPGHRPIELDDHRPGGPDRRLDRLDRRPQRAEAVRIGRRRIGQHDVERQDAALEEVGHVGQEDRDVVGPAVVDGRPGVGADEQGPMAEVTGHRRRQVRPGTLHVEVDHAHVVQLGRPGDERVKEDRRGGRGALEIDLLAALDSGHGLGRRYDPHQPTLVEPGDRDAGPGRAGLPAVPGPIRRARCRPVDRGDG